MMKEVSEREFNEYCAKVKGIIKWFLSLFSRKQCASLHEHKNGGYVYCIKNAGHLGMCESYDGKELLNRSVCHDCHRPIDNNDDANVCIDCGGRNTRRK
jgi:hypothetical protein